MPSADPEKRRAARQKWREANPEYFKDYYAANKAALVAYHSMYYLENIEKQKVYNRLSKVKERRNIRAKERRETDPNFKLRHNLADRIYLALKGKNKSAKTLELLGCSLSFLRKRLESLFHPGMTWENYGRYGWHVDHKRPCAKFDLTDPAQQRECFHYTNLQPLWATENHKKHAKFSLCS